MIRYWCDKIQAAVVMQDGWRWCPYCGDDVGEHDFIADSLREPPRDRGEAVAVNGLAALTTKHPEGPSA